MNKRVALGAAAIAVLLAIVGAWWINDHSAQRKTDPASTHAVPKKGEVINGVVQDGSGKQVLYWHDPMVPGHKFNQPGKSPFMDMQLVPQYAGEHGEDGVRISPAVTQNLGVRIGMAEIAPLINSFTAGCRMAFDEHQVEAVQTRTAGFVERLYVRAEGDPVQVGQKVAEVYAPELLAAQHELVTLARIANVPDIESLREAARERLRLLGMSRGEIRSVEQLGTPRPRVGVYAPSSGIGRELGVREAAQVMPGQTTVQLAGLERVWVLAELTERESGRVRKGQSAQISVGALPGETFEGTVDYVYPQLDAASRTVPVRIEVENNSGSLRPGMYAQVVLATEQRDALTVPSEAVIATGTRKVVLVRDGQSFLPVEIQTAGEASGRTEVLTGLQAGTEVVLSGQFLIDSEASLNGVLARLQSGAADVPPQRASEQATVTGQGTEVKVAPAQGMVTLSHAPIQALQWPEMTMAFKVRDPAAAQHLTPGAKVRFELKKEPEAGEYIIETIQPLDGSGQ